MSLNIDQDTNGFKITFHQRLFFHHRIDCPMIRLATGEDSSSMIHGNFTINDTILNEFPLSNFTIHSESPEHYRITWLIKPNNQFIIELQSSKDILTLNFKCTLPEINRIWINMVSSLNESFYGCGEQFSFFNLKGRSFALWVSEAGVGRDDNNPITQLRNKDNHGGGEYDSTYFPQSKFISSDHYGCELNSTAYMQFDFTPTDHYSLHCWEVPTSLTLCHDTSFCGLLKKQNNHNTSPAHLPSWVFDGLIVGLQGGIEKIKQQVTSLLNNDIPITAIWVQDWVGTNTTSFGDRLNWNWQLNTQRYPELSLYIAELKEQNIRFLSYINPYLRHDTPLFKVADQHGFLVKNQKNAAYLIDFGEFLGGIIDLTNPNAQQWLQHEVLEKEMLTLGVDGWMADFGEYLPTDCNLYDNSDPKLSHNHWPVLWAQTQYNTLKAADNSSELLVFMRSGFNDSQQYHSVFWAGDQCVDFSKHDGLPSTIPAALSSGISGIPIHHSDIGGFTSLYGLTRSKELFQRWIELAAFTPIMRTHEGNRPKDNYQFYNDTSCFQSIKKMLDIHIKLKPYFLHLLEEARNKQLPFQRPLFLHYESDDQTYGLQDQFLLGEDILVAPVLAANNKERKVYLPNDTWHHLFSGKTYKGGLHMISSPLGEPPVFYRIASHFRELFDNIHTSVNKTARQD